MLNGGSKESQQAQISQKDSGKKTSRDDAFMNEHNYSTEAQRRLT